MNMLGRTCIELDPTYACIYNLDKVKTPVAVAEDTTRMAYDLHLALSLFFLSTEHFIKKKITSVEGANSD